MVEHRVDVLQLSGWQCCIILKGNDYRAAACVSSLCLAFPGRAVQQQDQKNPCALSSSDETHLPHAFYSIVCTQCDMTADFDCIRCHACKRRKPLARERPMSRSCHAARLLGGYNDDFFMYQAFDIPV